MGRMRQRKCFMGLSTAQDRAANECPKGLVFGNIDVHAGVMHSQSCRSQRFLGLWVPARASGSDVCEENIACTIFAVGAMVAAIVGMMFVECFYMVGILAVCQALALALQQGGPVVCGKQQRHIIRPWSQHLGPTRWSGESLSGQGQ